MYNLFYFLFVIVFTQGLIQNLLSATVARWLIEPLIAIILLITISRNIRRSPFMISIAFFLLIFIVSCGYHKDFNLASYTFFKPFIYSFIIFYASYHARFTNNQIAKLKQLIYTLVLIQLPACVIKVIAVGGFAEKNVGTMSYSGGSLHLVFPMLVVGFLLGFYFFIKKDNKYLYLILAFIFFGVTGAKKGVPFYLLGLILFAFLFHNVYVLKKTINFFKVVQGIAIASVLFYFSVILIPGLNKEKTIGGSFDLDWLQDKVYSYSFYDEEKDLYQGRMGGIKVLVEDLLNDQTNYLTKKNLTTSFIGYKPSSFDESSYLTGNENVNEEHNRIIPTGFFRMLFAMGVLGVVGFMFFYGSVFNYCRTLFFKKLNYFSAYGKALVFGCLLFSVVIFVDFFTYSHMYTFSTIYVFYFFILGQLAVYKPNNVHLFVPKDSDLIQTNYTSVTQQ